MILKSLWTYIILSINVLMVWRTDAQLVTNSSFSPNHLVQNVLIGNGVSVSNIQYTGAEEAIGYFNGTNTNIGLEEGVLITTGTVLNNNNGPHGPNNDGLIGAGASFDNNAVGYNRLSLLVGENTYNSAILEFDFVPQSDSVFFKYVFASEEYHQFVNSSFNDVFAFFISGPGIAGTKNMALIPGTSLPVTINNVNRGQGDCSNGPSGVCTNCQYFIDNCGGQTIQYNGFTTPLVAASKVQCGETYHLIIAIADVSDPLLDSGIFLEANSLSSSPTVEISQTASSPISDSKTTLHEGCSTGTLTLTRNTGIDWSLVIPITVSGTATSGTDYTNGNIPPQIVFNPGQSTSSFSFDALFDGIPEGDETIVFTFSIPDPCGGFSTETYTYTIKNSDSISVAIDDVNILCEGDQVELTPEISGGAPEYSYQWSNGSTSKDIQVNPTSTETYLLTVNDACIKVPKTVSVTVDIPDYDPLSVQVTDDIIEICPNIPQTLQATASGGAGNYTYTWSWDDTVQNSSTANVKPFSTTIYTVVVKDQCGLETTEQTSVTVTAPPLILKTSNDTLVCPGDATSIEVYPSGGIPDYTYLWLDNNDTDSQTVVRPNKTQYYVVEVQDSCATFSVFDSVLVEVTEPQADFNILSTILYEGIPIQFQNTTTDGERYFWDFGNLETSEQTHGMTIYEDPGVYEVTLTAWNEIDCVDSITKTIRILNEFYYYVPNAFSPNNDAINDEFKVSVINANSFRLRIFNRWGGLIFESENPEKGWDGTYQGERLKGDVFVYDLLIESINGDFIENKGHVTLVR